MYRDTTALSGNPFGPSFPANADNIERLPYLTNLDRLPLRIDQCSELSKLFCQEILDMGAHMKRFHDLMEERGYGFREGELQRGLNSALVVIRGAVGAGKTTLGAWMISEVARLPGDDWEIIHLTDPASLKENLLSVPAGRHVAVLVENVTEDGLKIATALFNDLQKWPRLFVLTTHNLKLLDADERALAGSARIEVFTLRPVDSADADAYVAHRLPQFRDPARKEILAVSPVFPFPAGLAGRYVHRATAAGTSLPIVVRQLNAHFLAKLTNHARKLRDRPGFVSVAIACPQELESYLMPDV